MSKNRWIQVGAFCCLIGVACGAFAAHQLANVLSAADLDIFKKGVYYNFIHALAIILTTLISFHFGTKAIRMANVLFLVGIIFFSGSLLLISTISLTHFQIPTAIYLITPAGGICFMLGWILLIVGVSRRSN